MASIKTLYRARRSSSPIQSITRVTLTPSAQVHGMERLRHWDLFSFPLEWSLYTPLLCVEKDECSFCIGGPNSYIQFNF